MDVGRLDILRDIVQNRVTDLQMLEVEVDMVEVEGVKPDEFTMASTSKRFRKGGDFNGSYSRGQGSGGYSVRPIQSSYRL